MIILKDVNIPYNGKWKRQDVAIENGIYNEISDSISPVIEDGQINKIVSSDYESYLLPAMIDPHVHVREPGFDYKEDWSSCSKAALKGGVSTIIDMPNNKIPVDDLTKLKHKDDIAQSKSYVNYGLYIALTDKNAEEISEGLFDNYICGIKIYMAKTTGNLLVESPKTIKKALLQSKPVLVHAGGEKGLLKLMGVVEEVYNKYGRIPIVYICHISTVEEINILKYYKKKFSNIIGEVTPHHLFLTQDKYDGPPGVLPALGNKEDQKALWDSLIDGTINVIGTDHAPHTLAEKKSDNPPSGFPGLETALPLLFDSLVDGKLSLNRLIEVTSGTAAKIFSIRGYNGIEKGKQANCTLIIEKSWKVGEDGYQTKCNWSPFEAKKLKIKIYLTIVNGDVSFIDDKYYHNDIKNLCRSYS